MKRMLLLGFALAMLLVSHVASDRADAARNAKRDPNDLVYLPEGRILRMLSLGHPSLVADLVWLQAIQYYGEQRLTTRNYDQTARFFSAIYDLDPTFMSATRFGWSCSARFSSARADSGSPASCERMSAPKRVADMNVGSRS